MDFDYLRFADISMSSLLHTLPSDDQPTGLYYRGNLGLLQQNWVGFTGSETPTQGGKEVAYALASMIGTWGNGYIPVSGGCPGIDTAAHCGAVHNGLPTVVILPHSLNPQDYYKGKVGRTTNEALYEQVLENNGLLISEYEEGDTWKGKTMNPNHRWRTLERNRLIAASLVTIAVQWDSPQSGTMSTVRHAKRYHREVWVPAPRTLDINEHMDQCAGTVQYLKEHNNPQYVLRKSSAAWMEEHLQEIASASRAWGFHAR